MHKHYVRIDAESYVIHAYSDAFEPCTPGDICIAENTGRHFSLNGVENPILVCPLSCPLYRFINGGVVYDPKITPNLPIYPNEIEELKARIRIAERAAIENSEANQGLLELLIEMEVI